MYWFSCCFSPLPDAVTFDEFKEIMFGVPRKSVYSSKELLKYETFFHSNQNNVVDAMSNSLDFFLYNHCIEFAILKGLPIRI